MGLLEASDADTPNSHVGDLARCRSVETARFDVSYVRLLWRSARRPAVARRCLAIALTVGTVLTLVNQWGALTGARSDDALWLRILADYVVPFVVGNLGAASYANEK